MSWNFIIKTSYRDPLANSSIHCGHLLFVLLQSELHKKRCLQKRKVWRMCSVFGCFEFFLTAHVCTLRVCPYDDLPSAAWTAPPLGRRDTEILPGWRSPRAAPRTTSCRQKQAGASHFSARLNVFLAFHQDWIGKAAARDTHTSLWCVYIRSNRASGAIHLTGKRPCGKDLHVTATCSVYICEQR